MIKLSGNKHVLYSPIDSLRGEYKKIGEYDTYQEAREKQEEIY